MSATDVPVRPIKPGEARPGGPTMMKAVAVFPGSRLDASGGDAEAAPGGCARRPRRAGQGAAGRRGRHRQGDQRRRIRRGARRATTSWSPATRASAGWRRWGRTSPSCRPGDYVVATVRRPGSSIYDRIGTYDMTTDDVYFERGINLRHGYLTEYYVDDPEYIVKVPPELREVGVLLEPTTVVEKGIAQAYEIQRRLRVWRPRKAAVMGAGHHRPAGHPGAAAARARGDGRSAARPSRTSTPT